MDRLLASISTGEGYEHFLEYGWFDVLPQKGDKLRVKGVCYTVTEIVHEVRTGSSGISIYVSPV
jgi:hypothetical protein